MNDFSVIPLSTMASEFRFVSRRVQQFPVMLM